MSPESYKDRRSFRRYQCLPSKFTLTINGQRFTAELIDYSFDGIGAFIEDSPLITKNETVVDVDTDIPHLHTKGTVVWSKKTSPGITVGIKRFDFPRTGRLKDYPLADIFIGLQRNAVTGVLQLTTSAVLKKIFIRNGDVIFSTSNQKEDNLGGYLFKTRAITIEQYKSYLSAIESTGKKEGAVLVQLGYIRTQELPEIVRNLSEEIILNAFSLEDADYEFIEGPLPADEVIPLKLSAANIIYHGVKRLQNPDMVLNLLKIQNDTVLSFSEDPLDLFQDIKIDAMDKKIISCIDGKRCVSDVIAESGVKEFLVLKTLYALLSTRMIEIHGEAGDQAGFSVEDIIQEDAVEEEKEFIAKAEDLYGKYESLGYYGVLGVKKWASADEIKREYYRMAREFHPDKHFRIKSNELKGKLNSIFAYITAAYTTLSNQQKRFEYDALLANEKKPVSSMNNTETAQAKFAEGRKEFRKGNYQDAFQMFGQAVYLNNSIAEYHYYYGLSLLKLQRFKEAERSITRALERAPSNAGYLTELGYIYLSLGFPHRAKSTFEKALKINPSNARANDGISKSQESV